MHVLPRDCKLASIIFNRMKDFEMGLISSTGGIIWEVEGRGSGSKGVAYHTDSPTRRFPSLRLGLVGLYDMLPPYSHSPDLPPPK